MKITSSSTANSLILSLAGAMLQIMPFGRSVAADRRDQRLVVNKAKLVHDAPGIADLGRIAFVTLAQPPKAFVERADWRSRFKRAHLRSAVRDGACRAQYLLGDLAICLLRVVSGGTDAECLANVAVVGGHAVGQKPVEDL
jgi:hypothetical protein